MFSGKTEELIRRLENVCKLLIQKGRDISSLAVDTRYDAIDVVSHNATMLFARLLYPILKIFYCLAEGMDVVGIDEAQFLDEELPIVCEALAKKRYSGDCSRSRHGF
jgi:thymidine kinase